MNGSPRIILATRRIACPPDAIVIDMQGMAIGRGHDWWALRSTGQHVFNVRLRFFTALLVRAPGIIAWPELLDHIYGDDPDGGPLAGQRNLTVMIYQDRKSLSSIGLHIECIHWAVSLSWLPSAEYSKAAA